MSKPHRELTEREKLPKHADTAHAGGFYDFERGFRWAERRIEELEGALKILIPHTYEKDGDGHYDTPLTLELRAILASANSRED